MKPGHNVKLNMGEENKKSLSGDTETWIMH